MLDIMIPFWGEPRYLYETVEAVLSQTDARWHLTVVDDCYPDPGVPKYFEHLDHPQVTYIRNEENPSREVPAGGHLPARGPAHRFPGARCQHPD